MIKLYHFLKKYSRPKYIITGIIYILIVNMVLFPLFSIPGIKLQNILDLHFGFNFNNVQKLMSHLQAEGRHQYLINTLFIDTPYAMIYGWVYALIIILLGSKARVKEQELKYFIILPLLIGFFDLIENAGIVYFIKYIPNISPKIVQMVSLANQLKWILAILTFFLVLWLIVKWLYNQFNERY